MIEAELMQIIKTTFQLNWKGVHGLPHWARVRVNGLLLARANGANQRVVELFAFLHDVKREAEFNDPLHGERAADFIKQLPDKLLDINALEKEMLMEACHDHSKGMTEAELTIQTCWDADRLDLGRGGNRPSTTRLCTDQARQPDFLEQAYQRSIYRHQKEKPADCVQIWRPA